MFGSSVIIEADGIVGHVGVVSCRVGHVVSRSWFLNSLRDWVGWIRWIFLFHKFDDDDDDDDDE